MGLRDSLAAGLARQLGEPSGLRGRAIGAILNRRNGRMMAGAIDALHVRGGETAADIGFGGGLGLALLLDRVRGAAGGVVHGVDISSTMITRARRRFAAETADGTLRLHHGSLTGLPLADGSTDAVVTTNTVYFIDDLDQALRELVRVLSPAGRVAVGIGDPAAMSRESFTQHGFRLRPVDDVRAAMTAVGLSVDHRRVGEHPGAAHLLVARLP